LGGRGKCAPTVSSGMPYWLSAVGFISTLTARQRELPPTMTWPTPGSWESFCCRMLEPVVHLARRSVSEVRATIMNGGRRSRIDLAVVRVVGSVGGQVPRAALMAACARRWAGAVDFRGKGELQRGMLVEPR